MKSLISRMSNEQTTIRFLFLMTLPILSFITFVFYSTISGKLTVMECIGFFVIALLSAIILLLMAIWVDIRKIINDRK